MTKITDKGRNQLLATVGTAMAASMMVTSAQAAETVVTPISAFPPVATTATTGHDTVDAILNNVAAITATIQNVDGGVSQTVTPVTVTSITVSGQDLTGTAIGNNFNNDTLDLSVIENDLLLGDGAAALGFAVNLGAITGTVDNNDIYIDLEDFATGSLAVTSNSIEGAATGNAGNTVLAGTIPNDYSSNAGGLSVIDNTGAPLADWLDADGSLVASTIQINANPDIDSQATDNWIYIDLTSTADNTVISGPAVEDNSIASKAKGNSSSSTIDIQAGGSPVFTGSAVLTNGQTNFDVSGNGQIDAYAYANEIFAVVEAFDYADTNTLAGSLSVSSNEITASASGNEALGSAAGQAGNRILLADGMSFDGNADGASVDTAYASSALTSTAGADVVIHNSQGNVGASNGNRLTVISDVEDNYIYADVEAVDTGSVTVADNAITGTTRGNTASSAFATGTGTAYFNGTVAVANQQTNLFTNSNAQVYGSEITADVGYGEGAVFQDSTLLVDGNRIAASAYGNQVTQSVSLAANSMDMPDNRVNLTGGTGPDGNVHAQGNVLVTNLQSQYSANVAASDDTVIYADSDAITTFDSSISTTDNTQEAVALGNAASNALSLSGTSTETGAGIASVQIVADASVINASSDSIAYSEANNVSGSTIETSGNLQRSIAYGGSAGNTLSVQGENIVVDSTVDELASLVTVNTGAVDGFALDYTNAPAVDAAYGVLNVQSVSAQISAYAVGDGSGSSARTNIYGDVLGGSTIITDGNSLVAAAYGTEANNKASLDVGNLVATEGDIIGQPDFASVLNVTNAQTVAEGSAIYAEASGENAFETYILSDVDGSSVSTSDNTVQAVGYGNLASSSVKVTSTNIDTEADIWPSGVRGSASVSGNQISTDASFSLNSAQFAGGTITVSLLDQLIDPVSSADVLTDIGDNVTNSSVVSNGNTLSAGATANRADNLVDLSGNTLATTSALTNYQQSEADLAAYIGVEGGAPTPFIPGSPGSTVTDDGTGGGTMSQSGSTLTVSTAPVTVTFTGHTFTAAEVAYLNGLSGVSGASLGGNTVTFAVGAIDLSAFASPLFGLGGDSTAGTGDETILLSGFTAPTILDTPATPGTPNIGGVSIAIGNNVVGSTISVDDNQIAGSVTGNSAANVLKVVGTSVPDGSDHFQGTATAVGTDTLASGDHMLTNVQIVGDTALTSAVYSTLSIDTTAGAVITDSTLTVDGNDQSSRAVANTASNSLSLDATNTDAASVLASNQASEASVSATSNVDIFAPVSSNGTSVSLSDNTNLAVGVINNVSNTLTLTGTNINPNFTSRDVLLDVDSDVYGGGDNILLNQQVAQTSVSATAVTTIYNEDGTYLSTDGIVDGSVTISGNSTAAEASANRAVNVANATAGASLGASVGVVNSQSSEANVLATATTNAGVNLAGDPVLDAPALNGSSVTLGSNTTSSLARGNSAVNALNYSAGANYGDVDLLAGTGAYTQTQPGNVTTSARAAVLNVQSNVGAVEAISTQSSYVVALNSTAGDPTITNATVGVIGNAVSAAAYGNTASNVVTVAALNTNMPTVAVGNVQYNNGAVTASVTTVSYGITSGLGAVAGSSLSVTNNAITATAIGNNAANAIIGN